LPENNLMAEHPRRALFNAAACLLLLLMAVLAGGAAFRESVTLDEIAHIGAGVSYVQKFDLRLNEEHPPLPKVLAALPLVARGTHADYSYRPWVLSESFAPAYLGQWIFGEKIVNEWNDQASTLACARAPMLLLTLLLGWAIYCCACRLGGEWAGLLCLTLYVSMPLFLAFGPLVHTDIAVTLFSLLTLWKFADLWQEPNRKNTALLALAFGAALLSKFTAGILLFAFVAFALSTRWRAVPSQPSSKAEARSWRRTRRRATWQAIAGAAVVVYVFYLAFSWNEPLSALDRLGHSAAMAPLQRLLMPSWLYVRGVLFMLATASRPTFLLGHAYPHGVWFYFPIVFVLKTPIGFLGLLLLALALTRLPKKMVKDPARRTETHAATSCTLPFEYRIHWRVLWTALVVFVAFCLLSRLDISIRHFSIPVVLLVLLLAPLPELIRQRASGPATSMGFAPLVALLAGSCVFAAIQQYPFYFPDMNSLNFGHPVYELVNDSNVDWDQSLPEVQRFVEQHNLQQLPLDDYSLGGSSAAVPKSRLWNCQTATNAEAGAWVVISANMILDAHNCVWLMQYPHETLAGGSMYAIHLPNPLPAAGASAGPPLPADYHQFIGQTADMRAIFADLASHPEKFPATLDEMQALMTNPSSPQSGTTTAPAAH
jgi:4-amino-4-deoxy-L-arabinose transferase-like glycosyltransferase